MLAPQALQATQYKHGCHGLWLFDEATKSSTWIEIWIVLEALKV